MKELAVFHIMRGDFKNISYLKQGNFKQKKAFRLITENNILEILSDYNPIVVGTIPINIDIEDSDLDIILQSNNFDKLKSLMDKNFSHHQNYQINVLNDEILICNFKIENLAFEFYAKNYETEKQYGYLHMIKENEILKNKDELFRQQIIELKNNGVKTELAFCQVLKVSGDPYIELLKFKFN